MPSTLPYNPAADPSLADQAQGQSSSLPYNPAADKTLNSSAPTVRLPYNPAMDKSLPPAVRTASPVAKLPYNPATDTSIAPRQQTTTPQAPSNPYAPTDQLAKDLRTQLGDTSINDPLGQRMPQTQAGQKTWLQSRIQATKQDVYNNPPRSVNELTAKNLIDTAKDQFDPTNQYSQGVAARTKMGAAHRIGQMILQGDYDSAGLPPVPGTYQDSGKSTGKPDFDIQLRRSYWANHVQDLYNNAQQQNYAAGNQAIGAIANDLTFGRGNVGKLGWGAATAMGLQPYEQAASGGPAGIGQYIVAHPIESVSNAANIGLMALSHGGFKIPHVAQEEGAEGVVPGEASSEPAATPAVPEAPSASPVHDFARAHPEATAEQLSTQFDLKPSEAQQVLAEAKVPAAQPAAHAPAEASTALPVAAAEPTPAATPKAEPVASEGQPDPTTPPLTTVKNAGELADALQQHFGYDSKTAKASAGIAQSLADTAAARYPDIYPTPESWYDQHIAGVTSDGQFQKTIDNAENEVQSPNERAGVTGTAQGVPPTLSEPAARTESVAAPNADAGPTSRVPQVAGQEPPLAAPSGYTELPLNRIHPAPGDFQQRESPYSETTADAIHKEGYNDAKYNPIPVFHDTEGKYGAAGNYVVAGDGHSRYEGFRRLDAEGRMPNTIPVKIVSESDAARLKTEANTGTVPFTPLELSSVYQRDIDAGKSVGDIARTHRSTVPRVNDALALNNLSGYLQQMVRIGAMKPEMGAALGKWIKANDVAPADADNIFTKFISQNQMTRSELERALNTITKARDASKQLGFGGLLEGTTKTGESFVSALGRLTTARKVADTAAAEMKKMNTLANKHEFSSSTLKEINDAYVAAVQKAQTIERQLAVEQSPNLKNSLAKAAHPSLMPEEGATALDRAQAKAPSIETAHVPDKDTGALFQGPKGSVTFDEAGKATISAMSNPDASTAIHELGHILVRTLRNDDLAAVEKWNAGKLSEWTVAQHERFARAWERYIRTGAAPTAKLADAFAVMRQALVKVYSKIKGSAIDVPVSRDLKAVFDRVLGKDLEVPVSKAGQKYAGSINLKRMDVTEDVKAQVKEDANGNPKPASQARTETVANAKKLNLTPEQVKGIPLGEVPSGIKPREYVQALRELHAKLQLDSRDAERIRQSDPTPETTAARDAARTTSADMFKHLQAVSHEAGGTLGIHNEPVTGLHAVLDRAQAALQALHDLPTTQEALGAVQDAARAVQVRVRRTKAVTVADRDAALERIRARQTDPEKVLYQSTEPPPKRGEGIDPKDMEDARIIAMHHIESGQRSPSAFAAAFRGDLPQASAADIERLYAEGKSGLAKEVTKKQVEVGQKFFADELASHLGVKGTADFMRGITEGPTGNAPLEKLLTGQSLTSAEADLINKHYAANVKEMPTKGIPSQAMDATNKLVKERRVITRKPPTFAARRQPMEEPLEATLQRRLVQGGVQPFIDRIGKDTADKLRNDPDTLTETEKRTIASGLKDFGRNAKKAQPTDISNLLTKIVRDAKNGKLKFDDVKSAVADEVMANVSAKDKQAASDALDAVKDDDTHALGNIYSKYMPTSKLNKFQFALRNSLLSGPMTLGKIIASHGLTQPLEETAVRGAASLFKGKNPEANVEGALPGATLRAGTAAIKAIPGAAHIIKVGPTAASFEGMRSPFKIENGALHSEPFINAPGFTGKAGQAFAEHVFNPLLRFPGRVHSAIFHIAREAAYARGVEDFARKAANKEGGTWQSHQADEDVVKNASDYADEQIFQNPNAMAKAENMLQGMFDREAAKGTQTRAGALLGSALMRVKFPFRNAPNNIFGRGFEYSGAGLPWAGVKYAIAKLGDEAKFTPSLAQDIKRSAARGIVGPAMLGALGYTLAKSGILTPPNSKKGEWGTINLLGHKLEYSQVQPLSTPLSIGGEIAKHGDIADVFSDNPYSRNAEEIRNIMEHQWAKEGAQQVTTFIPSVITQTAKQMDNGGKTKRYPRNFGQYIEEDIPGLRKNVPDSKKPRSNSSGGLGGGLDFKKELSLK